MENHMKKIINSIEMLVILIPLVIAGCGSQPQDTAIEKATPVKIGKVLKEDFSTPIHSIGFVTTSEEMKLSFKTGGIISEISVREGAHVKKGDVLATLNLTEINAQVSQAREAYDKSLRDNDRVKKLYTDSVVTLEQLQNMETALKVAKSNLEIANFNLNHSTIIAPEEGIILKRLLEENEMAAPGYPVFIFGTIGKTWKVKTGISDRDVVKTRIGDSAVVMLDAYPDETFSAVVSKISKGANPATGTYEIELELNTKDRYVASGFVANIELTPKEKDSFYIVPIESIMEADGKNGYVYTVTDSMKAKKTAVIIQAIQDSKVAVSKGLEEIGSVVTDGAAYLTDGDTVEIKE